MQRPTNTHQNLVAGSLINGSLGKVIGFVKALEAHNKRIDFGLPQCLNERYDPVAKTTKRQDPPSWLMGSERQWPLVEFTRSKRQILCVPMAFEASNAYGVVEATREQVCLSPSAVLLVYLTGVRTRFL